jgi:hypothetical protein
LRREWRSQRAAKGNGRWGRGHEVRYFWEGPNSEVFPPPPKIDNFLKKKLIRRIFYAGSIFKAE